LTKITTN